MSDDAANEDIPGLPKKAKKSKLMLILVAVNVLAVGGIGAYMVFVQGGPAAAEDAEEQPADEATGEGFGPLVEMSPIVTNLDDPQSGRYIKVTIFLEAKSDEKQLRIEEGLVPLRNRFLMFFSGVTVEDTQGEEKKVQMQDRLLELTDEVLGADLVRRVFFTEFVIQ